MNNSEEQVLKPQRRVVKYTVAVAVISLLVGGIWSYRVAAQNTPKNATTKVEAVANLQFSVYKSASCGCCIKWNNHLRQAGHKVTAHNTNRLYEYKTSVGVPDHLQSCHTAMVDGYVIEGHVPIKDIERLLRERPDAVGLSVPGMVSGSPGMENGRFDPYDVILFYKDGKTEVYASY